VLAWTAGICLVLALAGWLALKWIALGIARRVADLAEHHTATSINRGLTRAGIRIDGVRDVALRARYVADIDRLAWLMDRVIPLPRFLGAGSGIGLDALLGLIPGVGDAVSFAISSMIVIRAAQLGVPEALISRLIAIQITDVLIGAVPVAGDLFDIAYQADQKSAALVRAFIIDRDRAQGSDKL
jgi:hypothetical protein